MKRLIRLLGSLEVTVFLMVLVSLWFALAALLSVSSQYGNTMRLLNDQLATTSLFRLPPQGPFADGDTHHCWAHVIHHFDDSPGIGVEEIQV